LLSTARARPLAIVVAKAAISQPTGRPCRRLRGLAEDIRYPWVIAAE